MRWTSKAIGLIVMAGLLLPGAARAEWKRRPTSVTGTVGYDSNVARVNSMVGPVSDARLLLFGQTGVEYNRQRKLRLSFDLRPYYVKYPDESAFDRLELPLRTAGAWRLHGRATLELANVSWYTNFPNRDGGDRFYNSLRPEFVFRVNRRVVLSLGYRNLYRHQPRSNIDNTTVNGGAFSVRLTPTDRLTVGVTTSADRQSVQFVFPREEDGERYTFDFSLRLFVGRRTLIQSKYLYQRDDMNLVFAQGADPGKFGGAADDSADGILQSIRFLEDSDFNFWKSLVIVSTHTTVRENSSVQLLALYQRKRLDERVLDVASRPRRLDNTFVAQAAYQYPLGKRLSAVGHVRYERSDSNEPDREFTLSTVGLGLKYGF